MTLKESKTITTLSWEPKASPDNQITLDFTFENKENELFRSKIVRFLESISEEYFPFLTAYALHINSRNTFPHSSGIASSASSMGALALCLCSMEKAIVHPDMDMVSFYRKASNIARLGSGSASRSVYGFWAAWGEHPEIAQTRDEYAIDIHRDVHPVFNTYHNDILIVSSGEKAVSSTAGHQLMVNNPYAPARYQQANQRALQLIDILKIGDTEAFVHLAEAEALTLHALMMCSEPSYTLIQPNSLEIMKRIRHFREKTKLPVCFSLDAGPNIHFLYPREYMNRVQDFLNNELQPLCQDQCIIRDGVGHGPSIVDFHHGH